jgi:2-polyprenyl-3-methyl-5-hydroxy-6-metoxy-1,4-benzoquinol methylase
MQLPSSKLYRLVCEKGLAVVRPLAPSLQDPSGWNYGAARPPSYGAYGRLRNLITLAKARELLNGKPPGRVLEIAAGDAALSACLAREGHHVTANDLREENLRASVARFTNARDVRLLPGNLFDLDPERVGKFDLVIACEIIEHVAHSPEFLTQLKRFLAPGGRILVTTPNGQYFRNKLPTYSQTTNFDELEKEQFKPDADGHLFLITPQEMEQIATSAGLRLDELSVWATPFITGESGFRYLAAVMPLAFWYGLERAVRHLGGPVLRRLGNAMCAVLSEPAVAEIPVYAGSSERHGLSAMASAGSSK